MKKGQRASGNRSDLRRRAEELLEEKAAGSGADERAGEDAQRLVHELRVHQIELELQKEELERAREELEAGLERYTDLYDFAPVGYFTLSHDGTIRSANLNGARLLKLDRSRLLGTRFGHYVAAESRTAFDALIEKVFVSEQRGVCDVALHAEEGEPLWVHFEATGLEGGQECRAVLVDITERKRDQAALLEANQRLLESDRRKNHFLAVLSHELRNPLAPVRNSLYILGRAAPGGDQARRAQEVIGRQIDQLTRLVDDLLDLTRVTRGKVRLQRRRLELNELVRRTIEDHRTVFEMSDLQIQFEPAPQEVFVHADWNRVAQVLGNLLQNAAKFTPREGRVTVALSTDPSARHAVLSVADTGPGMTAEMLAHLFEPFMQADTTLDRSKGGLGLGLALTKGLVEQHDGSVEARSEGLGRGSEFIVRMPLDLTGQPGETRARKAAAKARRRVLIIEDNTDAADTLREILAFDGHEVSVAYDGPGGIDMARQIVPDLVLCDIGLPGMDGFAVARAFRADGALKHVRLVALSGYALPEDLHRAADAGFDSHLAKPPNLDELDRILTELPGVAEGRAPAADPRADPRR